MRCPKCSYISFDVVESCTKCGKDISKAVEELKGTVAEVPPPEFLKFEFESSESESFQEEETAGDEEAVMDLGLEEDEETVDFSVEEEAPATEAVEFEVEEEVAVEDAESDFQLDVEEPEEEALGISDLAPEEEMTSEEIAQEPEEEFEAEPAEVHEEELSTDFADEELPFETEAVAEDLAEPGVEKEAKELEDLEVEGIDLESSSAPKSGKVMPSVKTGTALDDFDIDLGELISPKKDKSDS